MRMFYDEDRGKVVSEKEVREFWDNELTDEEKSEYDNNFTFYINAMLTMNGGCCREVTRYDG